jgi:ankyrin repeat protein
MDHPNSAEYNFELHLASEAGNIEVVQMLLDLGADVDFSGGIWGHHFTSICSLGLFPP